MAVAADTDELGFERDVLAASMTHPVIVDFWAPWCAPCKQLMPLLEKEVTAAKGAVALAKVNIDQNPGLAQALRIQSVPTVYAFYQGRPVDGFSGARTESEVRAFVAKWAALANDNAAGAGALSAEEIKKLLAEGDDFFRAARTEDALARYAAVLDSAPDSAPAFSGLAACLFAAGDTEAVREMAAQATDAQRQDARLKGILFLLSLAEAPGDDPVAAALSSGRLEEGLDALIATVRRNRDDVAGQKARALLAEVLEALGPHHPLTALYRRRLSTVLFS